MALTRPRHNLDEDCKLKLKRLPTKLSVKPKFGDLEPEIIAKIRSELNSQQVIAETMKHWSGKNTRKYENEKFDINFGQTVKDQGSA